MVAQGNALGSESILIARPEGRRVPFHPFRAVDDNFARNPGRCPGLASFAPLARVAAVFRANETAGTRFMEVSLASKPISCLPLKMGTE